MRNVLIAAILVLAPTGLAQTAKPAPGPKPLDNLYACAEAVDSAQRLACFDAEVARLRAAEKAGDFAAVDVESVKQLQKESFGFNLPSLPKIALPRLSGEGPDTAEAKVVGVSGAGRVLALANGQTWRLTEPAPPGLKPGVEVEIRKASLGSYLLNIKGRNKSARVRREE